MKKCFVVFAIFAANLFYANDEQLYQACLFNNNQQACQTYLTRNKSRCNNYDAVGCLNLYFTYGSSSYRLFHKNMSEYEAMKNELRTKVKACMLGISEVCDEVKEEYIFYLKCKDDFEKC